MKDIDVLYYQLMHHPEVEVIDLIFTLKLGASPEAHALLEQYKVAKRSTINEEAT